MTSNEMEPSSFDGNDLDVDSTGANLVTDGGTDGTARLEAILVRMFTQLVGRVPDGDAEGHAMLVGFAKEMLENGIDVTYAE